MKWVHRLLGLVLAVLLLAGTFFLLLPAFQGGDVWRAFLDELQGRRIVAILWALAVLFSLIGYILSAVTGTPRAKYLAYETEFGNISISLRALQDFLGHLQKEFPAVVSLAPRVRALDESLDVMLEVRVREGAPIPEISRMLQERARQLVQEKIGIADIRQVEVKIEEIVKEKEKEARPLEITPMPPTPGEGV